MSSDPAPAVCFRGVAKAFGARRVLDGLDLTLARGEILAVIGPSGTGKSVTLRLASGQLFPTAGTVTLLGEDLSALGADGLARLRRRVGFLFQGGALLGWKTLAENVALPLVERDRLPPDAIAGRVRAALEEVGLADAGDLYPAEVSGGMVKRAAFARAIIEDPEVLFFDEPTSGLDPVMARTVDGLIARIGRTRHAACLVVTHDLAGALRYVDRVAFLKGGRFLQVAPPRELLAHPHPEVRAFLEAQSLEPTP